MARQWWSAPVGIRMGGPGVTRFVSSTQEAAECLLGSWPEDRGKAHQAALAACLAALEDKAPVEQARTAFVAAAVEAGIFVREGR